jgi:hypothetical protein
LKKLWQGRRHKQGIRERQAREAARRKRKRGLVEVVSLGQKRRRQRPKRLTAPRLFSLEQNAEGVVSFLNQMEMEAERRALRVELGKIRKLTPEAVALLAVRMKTCVHNNNKPIGGDTPKERGAYRLLQRSGFFELTKTLAQDQPLQTGRIARYGGSRVDGKLAKDLIRFGVECLLGEKRGHRRAFEVMIECMGNTKHHASDEALDLPWWATVYADEERKRVCFTFLDMEIGLLGSMKLKGLQHESGVVPKIETRD